jgi:preprotein translocase subunit YajC
MIFMVLMFAVFWFILIRPQQKRAKEHANMLNALKKGDQVMTRGGIIGKVTGVQDNIVTLEVQEKVRMRVGKSYIEALYSDATAKSPAQPAATTPSDAKT